ncbi:heparan-alpha-glucosaminide N-acetyltransferase [Azospirillum sp. SYSU D00513]|uniref:heparan-alpha-glucosaminide N-acetyltransferase n=1 Tax=Azospirillum sp. SYSU D00513 TaxID=2812561 RepID=UPI001A95B86E|nr:heparan-alpha-glucosaminide N-acetyltransferase [Azospirillum sp. SYSU D00513]
MAPSPPARAPTRLPLIDAARGAAILAMIAYHACWNLNLFGLAEFDLFGNPLWLAARTLILGSFLALSGLSLVLAAELGLDRRRFLRRLALLTAAAAAVSAVSYLAFPQSPIFFGVLHHIAVASVLGLAFVRLPWALTLATALAVIVAGETLSHPIFEQAPLQWVGLMSFEPNSNDYVPLFPWFGVVLLGIAAGRFRQERIRTAGAWEDGSGGWFPQGRAGRLLILAGRHSLAVYLLHQPVLLGLLWLLAQGVGVTPPEVRNFRESCTASCTMNGARPNVCAANCRCIADSLIEQGLWERTLADRLDPAQGEQVGIIAQRCMTPDPE